MHRPLPLVFPLALLALAAPTPAKTLAAHPQAEAQAESLAKELIAVRSVRGPDNKTRQAQALIRHDLLAGGWKDAEVAITPMGDTAYLVATWPGRDPSLKPLAYGISPIMIKDSDEYAHGLNTRPAIDFYLSLFASLSQ